MKKLLICAATFGLILLIVTGCGSMRTSAALQEPSQAATVWWEAEDAFAQNMSPGIQDLSQALSGRLSNGMWIEDSSNADSFARWLIDVPADGKYYFYLRKTAALAPMQYRFVTISTKAVVEEWKNIYHLPALDRVGLPDGRGDLVWGLVGQEDLKAGNQIFELRILSGKSSTVGLDCFLLSNHPFWPSDSQKPDEREYHAIAGYSAFVPRLDPFLRSSSLDLRRLNHDFAGQKGFLERKREHLVFQKETTPTRFFGVSLGMNAILMNNEQIDHMARTLAKFGVNMVRIRSQIQDTTSGDPGRINPLVLDRVHYAVSAFKRQGIYTHMSFYSPDHVRVSAAYGIPGYDAEADNLPSSPRSLLYFHPRMQLIYQRWARTLFQTPNPYQRGQICLADDPAVALVEFNAGDSILSESFNPGQSIPYDAVAPLERKFATWATARYGALQAALDAWKFPLGRDSGAEGRLGLMPAVWLKADELKLNPERKVRASAQVAFLTQLQRDFYSDLRYWMKYEIGIKCPIVASNATTVDESLFGPLDRFSAMGCDVLDYHASVAGYQRVAEPGRLSEGDRFWHREQLAAPRALRAIQYEEYPTIFSELSWPMPNHYRAEAPLFSAAYGALQGIDGILFADLESFNWGGLLSHSPVMTPAVLGQFPVAALMFRRGDIEKAPILVRQDLNLENLFLLQGTGSDEPNAPDPLRYENLPLESSRVSAFDPLAYYVGRVQRIFEKADSITQAPELEKLIDRRRQLVSSHDGALQMDYGNALLTINTDMTQAAVGRLNAYPTIRLKNVLLESTNEYGAVAASSLDDRPLGESRSILIQIMTSEQNFDYKESTPEPISGFTEIEQVGSSPINFQKISGKIAIQHDAPETLGVWALDANGYPMIGLHGKRVRYSKFQGMLVIDLEPDVLYYHILPINQMKF